MKNIIKSSKENWKKISIYLVLIILSSLFLNAIIVTLEKPEDYQTFLNSNDLEFNCSANSGEQTISNISLYHDVGGSFILNQTKKYGTEIQSTYETGLVLLMHFNNDSSYGENSTHVYDFSGNGNDGTVINVDYNNTGGKYSGAYEFKREFNALYPENHSIEVADSNSLDLTTKGTIAVWAKPYVPFASGWWVIVTKGDKYIGTSPYTLSMKSVASVTTKCRLSLYFGSPSLEQEILTTNSLNCSGSNWYHFVATWNGSNVTLYVNGVINVSVNQTYIPQADSNVLRIGGIKLEDSPFNGTIDELAIYNRTLSEAEIEILAGIKPNSTNQSFTVNNIPDGNYTWTCLASDNNSQSNWSIANRSFIVDIHAPIFTDVTITPSSDDDIDPGTFINITVNLTEPFVDTVILQYKQNSVSTFINKTMTNITTLNKSSNVFVSNFTTNTSGIWNYRIWADDTYGYANYSSTWNVTAEYDYSWQINTTNFGAISGILETNGTIGTLLLNNTGDYGLTFDLSSDWTGTVFNKTLPFDLSAKNVIAININVTFNSVAREDALVLTVDSTSVEADPSERNATATLVSYAGGAYLYNTLTSYPTTINQSGSFILYGNVKNVGNETAANTTLTWTLPSSNWVNTSGNLTQNVSSLTAGSTAYNNVTVNVSSLVEPGTYTISLDSSCDNNVVGCSDSESYSITVSCSDTDGVCGTGCNYLIDQDCSAPATTLGTSGGGGGGGGGGSYIVVEPTGQVLEFSKTIEIVRGEQDIFNIEIKNEYENKTLENLKLDLSGFAPQYMIISPGIIYSILPNESKIFSIELKIPSYKAYEEFILNATITGILTTGTQKEKYTEKQYIKLIVQEISREESNQNLLEAAAAIKSMIEKGFNVIKVEELFNHAENILENKRNKEAQNVANQIIDIKDKAFEVYNLLGRINEVLVNPKKKHLLTGGIVNKFSGNEQKIKLEILMINKFFISDSVKEMINLAIVAFERGDYELAGERAKEAQSLLILEWEGNLGLFLYLYWYFVLFTIVFLSISGIVSYKIYQKMSITGKIEDINNEEKNVTQLIRETQKKYFSKKIGSNDYRRINKQHEKKIAELRKKRLNLRNKRIKLLSSQQVFNNLEKERKHLESEIKILQTKYYKDRKISKREYSLQFKVLTERLAEIEGERITLHVLKGHKKVKNKKTKDKKSKNKILNSNKMKIKEVKSEGVKSKEAKSKGAKNKGVVNKEVKNKGVNK